MSDRLITNPTLEAPLGKAVPRNLRAGPMTKAHYDRVVQVVDHWWNGPIAVLAHPVFFYELGQYARVVEDTDQGDRLVGFLLGFIVPDSSAGPAVGYIHLVGIDPALRRRGVARALYNDFTSSCLAAGCHKMKAITTAGNEGSLRFHLALGWTATEDENYAGPSRRRMVLTRTL